MLSERGILLPTGSPEEIATALREVAEHPDRFQPMMHAASVWARQFSLDGLRSALREMLASRWSLDAPRGAMAAHSTLGPGTR